MRLLELVSLCAAAVFLVPRHASPPEAQLGAGAQDPAAKPAVGVAPTTHPSPHHFVRDFPARVDGGLVNVVVEIPAGTTAKWEVDKADGALRWEMRDGRPRVVKYIGYPGNYGMVPRTLLSKELGGDGDPLDVLLLGPAVDRGSVVQARVIGVLEMLDGGEQDDKLLAVAAGTNLEHVTSLEQLDREFPGVTTIVRTWFANYKGPGVIETKAFAGSERADSILAAAMAMYEAQ